MEREREKDAKELWVLEGMEGCVVRGLDPGSFPAACSRPPASLPPSSGLSFYQRPLKLEASHPFRGLSLSAKTVNHSSTVTVKKEVSASASVA